MTSTEELLPTRRVRTRNRSGLTLRAALADRDKARDALGALLDAECGSPATCIQDAHRAAYAALSATLTYEALTGDHA